MSGNGPSHMPSWPRKARGPDRIAPRGITTPWRGHRLPARPDDQGDRRRGGSVQVHRVPGAQRHPRGQPEGPGAGPLGDRADRLPAQPGRPQPGHPRHRLDRPGRLRGARADLLRPVLRQHGPRRHPGGPPARHPPGADAGRGPAGPRPAAGLPAARARRRGAVRVHPRGRPAAADPGRRAAARGAVRPAGRAGCRSATSTSTASPAPASRSTTWSSAAGAGSPRSPGRRTWPPARTGCAATTEALAAHGLRADEP